MHPDDKDTILQMLRNQIDHSQWDLAQAQKRIQVLEQALTDMIGSLEELGKISADEWFVFYSSSRARALRDVLADR